MTATLQPPQVDETLRSLSAPRRLLIDGKWKDAASGATFAVHNPSDGTVITHAAAGDAADVDQAVRAARRALESGPWSRMTPAERTRLFWKLADAIEEHADELALLESLDNGKPLTVAKAFDVHAAAEKFRYNAGWISKLNGETMNANRPGEWLVYSVREPVGVVGLIVPWNFPLIMAAGKIAPALAAGCTVVLKPAEQTPLSALRLGELMSEVGFPEGVVNIVTGFGETAGAALVDHPDIDKISFTGSTEVGKAILRGASSTMKRVTLELGGKSPLIVFPDADLEQAIPAAAGGIFFNSGQNCAASSRLYAHERVFDQVVEGIAEVAKKLTVGPGIDPATDLGPLVSREHLDRVTGYLDAGTAAGARLLTGGARLDGSGYFVEPTVFADVDHGMSIVREEIFGPVLSAASFTEDSLDRIAAKANDSLYGLTAYVWTRDLSTAHKMGRRLKAGTVNINCVGLDDAVPFGGRKQSGVGRENGREGVEMFTEVKSVIAAL